MKDELDDLMRLWQPDVPEPSAFQREVWRRIEQHAVADGWVERFFAGLARPRIASAGAALVLLAGVVLGSVLAGSKAQDSYLHAVNPYAQVASK
ncbi:MAG TPA: hypothetical protein VFS35_03625 [Terrimicrobiaceae bacterium]|nr:hypothetical protein [Terrimicrobiaceae bacterium]